MVQPLGVVFLLFRLGVVSRLRPAYYKLQTAPSSDGGYGIVVLDAVTTIPYSGRNILFKFKPAGTMEYRNDY